MTKLKLFKGKFLAAWLTVLALGSVMAATPLMAAVADSDQSIATVTFDGGDLTLNSVPSLDFGTHDISDGAESYGVQTTTGNIQVGDLRGTYDGWQLRASMSPFSVDVGGVDTPTLNGATITADGLTVTPAGGTTGIAPSGNDAFTLPSDNTETNILTANATQGTGVWDATIDNAKLNVAPGTAREGTAQATITWALHDAP